MLACARLSLAGYFEGIYVVNLPERTDRRREMEQELAQTDLGAKVEFFPAVRPDEAGDWPSIGARGCFRSHYDIIQRARENGLNNVLIFEDDLTLDPKLARHAESLLAELAERPWDLLYFGHVLELPAEPVSLQQAAPQLPIKTTHCYAVNGRAFDELLHFLELVMSRPAGHPLGGPTHYDGALSMFRTQHPARVTLYASPSLGHQRSSRSDITGRWFDEVAGLRWLADRARSLRARVRR
ncbi:MAG: glycosyltransferase family 25 protein [Myxococcales bacterium FL481]|nr:MAG: glycosyltransferase family 25 protein [Myxococcales bacterium FL481]